MSQELAIVIPAYKITYLRECLESIANQSNKRFHVYIGDDCSPHDIKTIVDEYKDRFELTYHRFEFNLGGADLVAQWHRCIDLTNGERYIWLFSDDDIMGAECVESFYSIPQEIRDNALVHYDISVLDSTNGRVLKKATRYPSILSAGDYLRLKLKGDIISFVVEFIFPRWLYEKIGGFQKFDLAWGSDFMTWLKMSSNCKYGIVTVESDEEATIKWRKSNENISPRKDRPITIRKIKALIENAKYIKHELKSYPANYHPIRYSFRWVRFPLGEIYRSRKILKISDVYSLIIDYLKKVIF